MAPTIPGLVVATRLVALTNCTGEAGESPDPPVADGPNSTSAPGWKWSPVMVTSVPPVTGPDVGDTLVTVGAGTYVNGTPLLVCALALGGVTVTVTFLVPVPAGATALSDVSVTFDTDVAFVVPNFTAVVEPETGEK